MIDRKRRNWSDGYLYVVDEAGQEIEGSRRHLRGCEEKADYQRVFRDLEMAMGEGCMVLDSETDRRPGDVG